MTNDPDGKAPDFIRAIVRDELASGRIERVVTRFPPEPNGYLHIGHAKSICLNFGIADEFGGVCHLRFDDTNPETEDVRYVEAIKKDVRWLGFDWGDHLFHASDYFEQLHAWAVQLIEQGRAYVDGSSEEEIRALRGTVTEPGRESADRERPVEESLDLFERMRGGEFPDGAYVLRARIDMAHPNMKMRDPLMYRIRHASHYRRGDDWCIYPFYDWAHGQSDAIESITHSVCTLEFENNRELYDWYLRSLGVEAPPRQFEFARLNVDYTVTSKRKLLQLVEQGHVSGWDDPRMPTIAGMRRRGVTPESIRAFCDLVGVTKADSRVDIGMLEYAIRDDLNFRAPRVMAVLRPLKVVITNYPEDREETLEASYWPHDVPRDGSRPVPFGRELWIERDDFMRDPPKKFFRLAPGREVRLRYGYVVRCDEVVEDESGEVVELRCSYDPETRGGSTPDGRRVRGTIHWVSARHAVRARVRLYDRLFAVAEPGAAGGDFVDDLNPTSLVEVDEALLEPSLASARPGEHYQFERLGYFYVDTLDSTADRPAFNRVVSLRDTWAKIAARDASTGGAESTRDEDGGTAPGRSGERSEAASSGSTRAGPAPEEPAPRERGPEETARYERYREAVGISDEAADFFAAEPSFGAFYDDALVSGADPESLAHWVRNDVRRVAGTDGLEKLEFGAAQLGALVAKIDAGDITGKVAKEVFNEMARSGEDPLEIIERRGLAKVDDPEVLEPLVNRLVEAHADKAQAYRQGRTGLLGFFVGQVMQETRGQADPELVQRLLRRRLD